MARVRDLAFFLMIPTFVWAILTLGWGLPQQLLAALFLIWLVAALLTGTRKRGV